MTGPDPAIARVRVAVRAALHDLVGAAAGPGPATDEPAGGVSEVAEVAGGLVLAACSGGADSTALAHAVAFEAPRAGLRAGALVVDHGLQTESERVAARAAHTCRELGLDPVLVQRVEVEAAGAGGPEAAARTARLTALERTARELGAVAVLLGHTRDDQAEQVLLGLLRGSGARSLAGIPPRRGIFVRPLLTLPRSDTEAACRAAGLPVWHDPHNDEPRFRRVRARHALEVLRQELGADPSAALARSAAQLRDDADALDALADARVAALAAGPWTCADLREGPAAVRARVWRLLAARAGATAGDVTAAHVAALEALAGGPRGAGTVWLPGGVPATRVGAVVWIGRVGSVPPPVGPSG